MPEARKSIDVAAALVFRGGRLLIAQRHRKAHLGGLWEFPGGKKENGEAWEDCVARELREELGIEVDVGCLVASISHDYPEKSVHLKFFLCRWLSNEPCTLGCSDFRWVNKLELGAYEFPEADAQLLEELRLNEEWWRP